MSVQNYKKLSRLYTAEPLAKGQVISLSKPEAHYLKNVMRRKNGDSIRLFNGQDGEWLGKITVLDKKIAEINPEEQLLTQTQKPFQTHLIFSPIKKDRMDFLIEKATELDADVFHPVITSNTQHNKINTERIERQVVQAAEQCERLSLPQLKSTHSLQSFFETWDRTIPVFTALERMPSNQDHLLSIIKSKIANQSSCALLVGPEGGFTDDEIDWLKSLEFVTPISFGKNILRTETAVCAGLALLNQATDQ